MWILLSIYKTLFFCVCLNFLSLNSTQIYRKADEKEKLKRVEDVEQCEKKRISDDNY